MASFIIHHTAGVEFLRILQESKDITLIDDDINSFLLGNLIVDSIKSDDKKRIQEEKIVTHFRSRDMLDHATQYPNLEEFLSKYKFVVASDYSALGYFFHLFTDYMFFTYLFNKTFEYVDEFGNVTKLLKDIRRVHIKKDDKYLEPSEFFNGNISGMYHDYTIMNRIVLDEFGIDIDIDSLIEWARTNFHNPGITEVDYERIVNVLNDLRRYIKSVDDIENQNLDVFRKEDIIEFIKRVSEVFISTYYKKSEKGLYLKID